MNNTEIVFAVEESPEGGFEARAIGFDIFSEADSMEQLRAELRDAVSCHFEEAERARMIRIHRDEVTRGRAATTRF